LVFLSVNLVLVKSLLELEEVVSTVLASSLSLIERALKVSKLSVEGGKTGFVVSDSSSKCNILSIQFSLGLEYVSFEELMGEFHRLCVVSSLSFVILYPGFQFSIKSVTCGKDFGSKGLVKEICLALDLSLEIAINLF